MTKLYQKLIKKAPSENEVRKGLKAVSLMNEGTPDKRMLMGILNSIDLTSLNPTDNKSNILQLTGKVNSFSGRFSNIPNVAAICVYPNFVSFVKEKLTAKSVRIASVAGGFPSSQTFRMLKVSECKMAVEAGADEIDIVMPVGAFFGKDFKQVAEEISEVKEAIGDKPLKVIIESGLLADYQSIFKASMIAMDAGADFIKTSTGKTPVSATPEAAYIMCRAIRHFYDETGIKVGFKAAGGITTTADAITYLNIVKNVIGEAWLSNSLFRIGASRLANNILADISGSRNDYF
ncbi:MAG TPA: deoxyribose-phosphate aldolase [Bacteroidales bacterium]|jgi:deoxyribose-phosphate aldolase|nr:deoxyribose-phosphate aldolase [Bacteroidales bacterium]MDI9553828.1 deoxyribose-phosphate aldolase [Bacteroidota bacterium]MBP7037870.1 deoxyribose-phosphate aldolase [Bacteroidales bacterium]NLK54263.1 deoxyribose-phosphate aldolase [Bacteroidales bacterium]HNY53402.1 deoxyribose-phosphate aldolase [Bacteroidales bacterium]